MYEEENRANVSEKVKLLIILKNCSLHQVIDFQSISSYHCGKVRTLRQNDQYMRQSQGKK